MCSFSPAAASLRSLVCLCALAALTLAACSDADEGALGTSDAAIDAATADGGLDVGATDPGGDDGPADAADAGCPAPCDPALLPEGPCWLLEQDPATCECSAAPDHNLTACNDANPCTLVDVCMKGVCTGLEELDCGGGGPCQAPGTCDPTTGGCVFEDASDGTACDDGDACTQGDVCTAGTCSGQAVGCPDGGPCVGATGCDPATGECQYAPLADGTACDDGDLCTDDVCVAGTCETTPVVCAAPGPCEVSLGCDPATGACGLDDAEDGAACDDGDACTQTDRCQTGTCVGDDPVVCTADDSCGSGACDPLTGGCTEAPAPDGTACEDDDPCTGSGSCLGGVCQAGDVVTCPPPGPCQQAGTCDSASGLCHYPPVADGTPCGADAGCGQGGSCQAGACVGAEEDPCEPFGPCLDAVCDALTGLCVPSPVPDGGACDDGDGCTYGDTCVLGECVGLPVSCPQTGCGVQACESPAGACVETAKPDATPCAGLTACPGTCGAGQCSEAEVLGWDLRHPAGDVVGAEVKTIAVAADGDLFMAGWIEPWSGQGVDRATIARVSPEGKLRWQYRYGPTDRHTQIHALEVLPTGAVVAGGAVWDDDGTAWNAPRDPWLLHVDADGSVVWERSYAADGVSEIRGLHLYADRSLAAAGINGDSGGFDGWAARLDAAGEPIWTTTWGDPGNLASDDERFYDVAPHPDGGVVVLGKEAATAPRVVHFGAGGGLVWDTTPSAAPSSIATPVQIAPRLGGGYVLGLQGYESYPGYQYVLLFLDEAGGLAQRWAFDAPADAKGLWLGGFHQSASDGGFVVGGYVDRSTSKPIYNAYVVRTDILGEVLMAVEYGKAAEFDQEEAGPAAFHPGGGVVFSGTTKQWPHLWMVRLDDGSVDTCP